MLDLGTLHLKMTAPTDNLERDLRRGEREVEQSGDRMGRTATETAMQWSDTVTRTWAEAGRRSGDGFWRGADGRLRDSRGRFVAAGAALGDAVGSGAQAGTGLLAGLFGNLGTAATNLSTNIWNLIPALLAVGAAMALVGPAALLLGGAIGALPAVAAGAFAAIATLGIGFMGLTDAFQETSGTYVDRARMIALAERRLADAHREVTAAQENLNRARERAAERIRDLSLSLAGARLDERDAVDAVEEAEDRLRRAREGGNAEQIEDAERALERARHQLELVRDRVGDLEQEQDRANREGVEGSDEVQAALERQRQATEAVTDAQYALRDAHRASAAAGAKEHTQLAASALAVVAVIKGLKDEFESLRLHVQQRLFAGVDKDLQKLATSWMPTLKARLGGMADVINGLFHEFTETSSDPVFVKNISKGMEHIERLVGRVGKAVLGPGLEAFGKLAKAAGPFLDAIGNGISGIVEDFATWIDESERSGELQTFFERAAKFVDRMFFAGSRVASIIGSILDILFQSGDKDKGAQGAASGFADALDRVAKWLDDPKNQEKIAEWINKIKNFMFWVFYTAIPKVKEWIDKLQDWADKVDGWIQKARDFKRDVTEAIDKVTEKVKGLKEGISRAATGMWDGIKNAFKAAINWIIDKWNNLSFSLPRANFLGVDIGGTVLSTQNIPRLADGGLVRATPGGRVVIAGEAGEDEIVSPVDQMRRVVAEELARIQAERGEPTFIAHVYVGDRELEDIVDVRIEEHDRGTVRSVRAGTGRR